MAKKKSTPKSKSCGKKCGKNNCKIKKDCQKKCNNQLPELKSYEIEISPQSKAGYVLGLIRKIFGYE